MKKKIHKFRRSLKTGAQYIVCTGKKANFSESVSYLWKKVECAKCLALMPK